MRLRHLLLALALSAALALAAACGGEDEAPDATGDESPAAGETAPAPTPTEVIVRYPLTLTDMLGRQVTIESKPVKVGALSPTTVELVYAVGGESLTRSSSVRFPEEATSAVDIGPSYQPNFELIAAQAPDVIIADSVLQPQLVQNLESLGVPVVYAGAQSFDDVVASLRVVGQALGMAEEGNNAAAALKGKLESLKAKLPATGPKVLILNGTPDDFYAAKPESYVGDLAALLNVTNVAAGQPDVGRFPGYTKLSLEAILTSGPDVVLAITAGPPGGPTITGALSGNPAWADVPAVKNGRVAEISMEVYLQAPGPRAGEALEELARLLYPEVFGQ